MNHRLFQVLTRPPVKWKQQGVSLIKAMHNKGTSEHPAVKEWSSRQARQTDEQADNESISINIFISHHPPNTAFLPDPVLRSNSLCRIWPSVTRLSLANSKMLTLQQSEGWNPAQFSLFFLFFFFFRADHHQTVSDFSPFR